MGDPEAAVYEPEDAAAPVDVATRALSTRRRLRSAGNGRAALDLTEPVQVAVPVNVAPLPPTRRHHQVAKKTTGATVARVQVSNYALYANNYRTISDAPRD